MVFSYTQFVGRSPSSSSSTRLMILQGIIVLILSTTTTVFSQYNSGIQYSAYSGGHEFPSHNVEYIDSTWNKAQELKSEGRSSKGDQVGSTFPRSPRSKQMDESMVAQMLNNPNAMKMVLNYLTKQNLKDHQNKWNKMSQTKNNGKSKNKKNSKKKKPVTTKKPKRTTTTKKPKTKSPILQITQIKRRNDDGGKSKDKKQQQKNKRRPRPPGGDFFDLAELFKLASLGGQINNRKKSQKGAENQNQPPPDLSFLFGRPPPLRNRPPPSNRRPHPKATPPPNVGNLNNPQLMGNKPKLDMFGPSDFVPTHPYSLPMKQHGPMKLTYMSAKEFPNIPKYGLIPIPRK